MNILNFIFWNYSIALKFQDSEKQNKIIFCFQLIFELTYQSQAHSGLDGGRREGHFCIEKKRILSN